MDLEMVLNELSLQTSAPDIPTARKWMSELIQTLRQATSSGVNRVLRTSDEINALMLTSDYPISRWRNDSEVDIDEKRFFKTLSTKAPFWTDVIEEIKDQFDLSDIWYQGKLAKGLGFVWMIDGLAVSFQSDSKWNCESLQLQIQRFNENDELINLVEEIKHVSDKRHLQCHQDWIINRIKITVVDGIELWERRVELFPSLEFCDSVKKQLQNILKGQRELAIVTKILSELEKCCSNWTVGQFSVEGYQFDESGESEVTLNQYSQERTFICPDGQKRLFARHLKLRTCNWRIHFLPLQSRKIIIGYIGKHLPTVKYKT